MGALEKIAKIRGYEIRSTSSEYSTGGPSDEKHFAVSIEGDQSIRDALMQEYQAHIESVLTMLGATITGKSVEGDVSKFEFYYQQSGVVGVFKASSVAHSSGMIQIEIFMNEHE